MSQLNCADGSPGRTGCAAALAPVALFAATMAIGLVGIGWGLPSAERNKLYFSGRPPEPPAISREKIERSWRYFPEFSWSFERRTSPDNLSVSVPRSVFNPIRSYDPDEYVVLKSISNMDPGRCDFDPKFFAWPALFIYLVAAGLKLASLVGYVSLQRDLGFYYLHPEEMARLYLVGRFLVCLFGAGTVAVVCVLGKRLCDWRVGALGGIALLLSPAFVVELHAMKPNVPMLFFAALALVECLRIEEPTGRSRLRHYLLAGLFIGLAASCKHEGVYLLGVLVVAHGVGLVRRDSARGLLRRNSWPRALAGIGVAAGAFALTSPYHIIHWRDALWVTSRELASVWAMLPLPAFLIPWHMLVCGMGMMASVFAVLGLLTGGPKTRALLISFAVLYVLAAWTAPQYVHHYLLLCLLVAVAAPASFYFVAVHPSRETPGRGRLLAAVALELLFVAALVLPGANVCGAFLRQPIGVNTRDAAGEWIAAHVPAGSRIAFVAEPWQYTTPPVDAVKYKVLVSGYDFDRLLAQRPDYFVLSSADFQYPYGVSLPLPEKVEFQTRLTLYGGSGKTVFERPLNPLFRPLYALGFTWPQDMLLTNPRFEIYKLAE